jgi:uncharacterized damage-inducible protein DinB
VPGHDRSATLQPEQALTLVRYNAWANHRVLVKAARLPRARLTGPAALSHDSVLGTLVHILDTQWYWRAGAQTGQLPLDRLSPADFPGAAALRRRWAAEDRLLLDYVTGLSARQLNSSVTYSWPRARPRRRPLWHVLQHIVNHGTQHRSEVGNYLARFGLSPGDLDFMKFVARAGH